MGHLKGLGHLPFSDEVPAAFDETTVIDGERMMFPFSLNYIGSFYNVQAVEEAGATVPTTWTEVLEFCDAATVRRAKVAFAYPGAGALGCAASGIRAERLARVRLRRRLLGGAAGW